MGGPSLATALAAVSLTGCVAGDVPREEARVFLLPAAVQAQQVALQTQPSRSPVAWAEAASASRGTTEVLGTYRRGGEWCRMIEEVAHTGTEQPASRKSIYCRDAAGMWRLTATG